MGDVAAAVAMETAAALVAETEATVTGKAEMERDAAAAEVADMEEIAEARFGEAPEAEVE